MLEIDVKRDAGVFHGTFDSLSLSLKFDTALWFFQKVMGSQRRPPARTKTLTQTFVGGVPGRPGPGSILVKGVTSLAVISHRVMLADADQAAVLPLDALAGVAVTLASEGREDS